MSGQRQRIELTEQARETLRISEADALRLARCRLGLQVELDTPGAYEVRSCNLVGVDLVDHLEIEVRPKLPITNLLYLLGETPEDLRLGDDVGHSGQPGAVVVLQELFATALSRVLSRGLPTLYVQRREKLPVVRGRIEVLELTTKGFGLVPPVPCAFDDQSFDTEPNRRLLAAAAALAALPVGRQATRTLLRRLANRLRSAVTSVRYGANLKELRVGKEVDLQLGKRGAASYRSALAIAQLVLSGSSAEFDKGNVSAASFVVNMDRVFERFLFERLRRSLDVPRSLWTKPSIYLDTRDRILLMPDMVEYLPDLRPRLVLDAKWKNTSEGESSDIRQMTLYCLSLGLPFGVLIYGNATSSGARHRIVETDIQIHVLDLDLSGSVADIDGQVGRLATRIRAIEHDTQRALGAASDHLAVLP